MSIFNVTLTYTWKNSRLDSYETLFWWPGVWAHQKKSKLNKLPFILHKRVEKVFGSFQLQKLLNIRISKFEWKNKLRTQNILITGILNLWIWNAWHILFCFRVSCRVHVCKFVNVPVPTYSYHRWLLQINTYIYLAVLQLIAQVYHKFSWRISIYLRMRRGLSNA